MNTDLLIVPEEAEPNPLLPLPRSVNIDEWMFEIAKPFIKGPTMEIGSGNEAIISCFLKNNLTLHLSDLTRDNCNLLRAKYNDNPLIHSIHSFNPLIANFEQIYSGRLGVFKTVIKINTANTIPLDTTAIHNAKLLLKEGGRLILLLPAQTTLYTLLEDEPKAINNHNRRYLRTLLGPDLEVQKTKYFNIPELSNNLPSNQTGLSVLVIARRIK